MLERGFYGGDRVINSNSPEFDTAECGICLPRVVCFAGGHHDLGGGSLFLT